MMQARAAIRNTRTTDVRLIQSQTLGHIQGFRGFSPSRYSKIGPDIASGYNTTMKASKPDFNQNAARIAKESTSDHETPLPADLEEAWAEWSRSIQKVDERGMTLLRAAFEAGYGAGVARRGDT